MTFYERGTRFEALDSRSGPGQSGRVERFGGTVRLRRRKPEGLRLQSRPRVELLGRRFSSRSDGVLRHQKVPWRASCGSPKGVNGVAERFIRTLKEPFC